MTIIMASERESIARSQAFCRELTRRERRNFYYALRLLPEPKRSAMYVLYAYMRLVDDIADCEDRRSQGQRELDLEAFRLRTHAAIDGEPCGGEDGIWPAFGDTAQQYHIPKPLFDDMIIGQKQDLAAIRFQRFEELRQYCYRVAGVVGLASIRIWGYEGGERTEMMAIDRGIALQLTNILRDLKEDAGRGRVYLPADDLTAAGVSEADLIDGRAGRGFLDLMRVEIDRAESYYRRSVPLEQRIEPDSRPALAAMTSIYHGLLKKIAAKPLCVLKGRVSLSLFSKLWIGWRALRGR